MGQKREHRPQGHLPIRSAKTARLVPLSIILVAFLVCGPVLASPCDQAYRLEYGFAAPCSGMLWPVEWSKRALVCVEIDLPELNAELARRIVELQSELTASTTTLTACRQALGACEQSIEEVVQPEREWWMHPGFWAAVGFVGAGLIFGSAWAIHDSL